MSMLDGIHLDIGSPTLLSPHTRLHRTDQEQCHTYLYAGLGQYGRLQCHVGNIGAWTECHFNSAQLYLYIYNDAQGEVRRTDSRQGVCHRSGRESLQSKSSNVLCPRLCFLAFLAALDKSASLRNGHRRCYREQPPKLRCHLDRGAELLLENHHYDHHVATVSHCP